MDAMQAKVSGAPVSAENRWVDALSVIPNPHSKLPFVIPDFHFDLSRVCVLECIADSLGGNAVDFVSENRMKVSRCAFHRHAKYGGILAGLGSREFLSEGADGDGKIVGHHRRGAQLLHGIAAPVSSDLGYEQIGVAYDRTERKRGETSFGLGSLVSFAVDGIVSHSTLPLRLASLIGVALSVFAVLAIAGYLMLWLTYEKSWPAGFATLAILILVSIALNATSQAREAASVALDTENLTDILDLIPWE